MIAQTWVASLSCCSYLLSVLSNAEVSSCWWWHTSVSWWRSDLWDHSISSRLWLHSAEIISWCVWPRSWINPPGRFIPVVSCSWAWPLSLPRSCTSISWCLRVQRWHWLALLLTIKLPILMITSWWTLLTHIASSTCTCSLQVHILESLVDLPDLSVIQVVRIPVDQSLNRGQLIKSLEVHIFVDT